MKQWQQAMCEARNRMRRNKGVRYVVRGVRSTHGWRYVVLTKDGPADAMLRRRGRDITRRRAW